MTTPAAIEKASQAAIIRLPLSFSASLLYMGKQAGEAMTDEQEKWYLTLTCL